MTTSRASAPSAGDAKPPLADIRHIQRLVDAELALPSRLRHTLLLVLGLGGAAATGALLATEVGLPPRTRVTLALLCGIGLSWAAFAAWVLARRRVLMAEQRVVAARMAITFTSLFSAGAFGLGVWGGVGRPGYAAAGLGLLMLGAAVALYVRARRRVAALSRRRAALERELADAMGAGGA
jgi:hypothetical protein